LPQETLPGAGGHHHQYVVLTVYNGLKGFVLPGAKFKIIPSDDLLSQTSNVFLIAISDADHTATCSDLRARRMEATF
jgi:hypothetical protein